MLYLSHIYKQLCFGQDSIVFSPDKFALTGGLDTVLYCFNGLSIHIYMVVKHCFPFETSVLLYKNNLA